MGNLKATKGPLNIFKKGDRVRKSLKKEKKRYYQNKLLRQLEVIIYIKLIK